MSRLNPTTTCFCLLLAAVILCAAAWLRFYGLEERPLHFDEATGARIVGYHLEGAQRPFDPKHFHGPLLNAVTTPVAKSQGQNSWSELTIIPLRSVTAVAGFLTAAACLLFPAHRMVTLAAAAFVATSPMLVYYSRMYIHEPLFVFAGILSLLALAKYCENPKVSWALCVGLAVGLMAATRETVVIALFSWTVAGMLIWWQSDVSHRPSDWMAKLRPHQLSICLAGTACLLTIFIFYSQYGRQPSGFIDFFRTFFVYETTAGHEKPWYYYFNLLVLPERTMGILWTEAAVLLLAVCGYFLTPKGPARLTCRFVLTSGLILFLVFSLISYKTPWLISLAWLHVCLAAGFGLTGIIQLLPNKAKVLAAIILIGIFSWQGVQAYRAAFRWANDNRNPYAYVPTSPDVVRMSQWLERLMSDYPQLHEGPQVVLGSGYWPLPWYLRSMEPTAYYRTVNDVPGLAATPIIFTTGTIPANSQNSHQWLPRGLRHEVTLWLGIRKDIWEAYQSDD